MREALKAHSGSAVKTMGDGFMAAFASATKALECAIAIQRAFGERNARPSPLTLSDRDRTPMFHSESPSKGERSDNLSLMLRGPQHERIAALALRHWVSRLA